MIRTDIKFLGWLLVGCLTAALAFGQTSSNSEPVTATAGGTPPAVPPMANPLPPADFSEFTNASPAFVIPDEATNSAAPLTETDKKNLQKFRDQLAKAKYLASTRQFTLAEPALVKLLADNVPDEIQRAALFELGAVVEGENDLPRSQSIYAQFLNRWSDDVHVPEILLRQGRLFRRMGLNDLALAKFYSVMTAALSLRQSQLTYYQQLVLEAQIEIAETNFQSGKYADAAEFYSRLLKNTDNALDHSQVQFLLIRCLEAAKKYDRAAGEAQDFLNRHPNAPQEPEVRYYLAESLKAQGRNGDALQQTLLFLKQEKAKAADHPDIWAYWQRRVGNEIGNQLYKEGDYVKALDVYLNLAKLDTAAAWQLPVEYQIGLTYEHLLQPEKARQTYTKIVARENDLGTNVTSELRTVLDMSHWRIGFLKWQNQAEVDNRTLAIRTETNSPAIP